jgi:hypothetical protein
MLIVGAETLHRDCRSGDVSDRYHACICQAVDVGHPETCGRCHDEDREGRDTAMIIVLAFPFALLWPGALIAMQM